MKQFDFQQCLKLGQTGEELLLKHWPELKKLSGRKSDFMLPDGTTMELKSDQYNMRETQNFFMEVYSNMFKQTPGSCWQARLHGSKWFCYWFPTNLVLYQFDTDMLCDFLDTYIKEKSPRRVEILNKGWTTLGVIVPRKDLRKLAELKDFNET